MCYEVNVCGGGFDLVKSYFDMWKYELLIYWFECWMFEGKVDVWLFGDEMFGVIEFVCFVL